MSFFSSGSSAIAASLVSKIAAAELAFLPDYDIGKKLLLTQFPKS